MLERQEEFLNSTPESSPCYLNFTYKALADIKEKFDNYSNASTPEATIKHLISLQSTFNVHIEKARGRSEEELYVNFYFDEATNPKLSAVLKNQIMNLYGVVKKDGVLIINVQKLPSYLGKANNRRITEPLHFFIKEKSNIPIPKDLIEKIEQLPIAKERSKIVKSRLESWDIYLEMIEQKAKDDEVKISYRNAKFTEHLRELNIQVDELKKSVANKNLRGAEVTLIWQDDKNNKNETVDERIGTVRRFDFKKNIVQVDLDEDYVELARTNKWTPTLNGIVHISNFGTLAQATRLKKGFKDLQNGVAQNPNLEYLLFEENPAMDTSVNKQDFEFKEAIQDQLNSYQRAAVQGALAAEDIYLIQGPPGTGKTTVIAEICYQNVERGLKTLIASQSNLAVDNALSKLLSHEKIRILRKGRTKSIEEEGKKFIEENVANTWKKQTLSSIEFDLQEIERLKTENEQLIEAYTHQLEENNEKLNHLERGPTIKQELQQLEIEQSSLKSQQVALEASIVEREKNVQLLKDTLEATADRKQFINDLLCEWTTQPVYERQKTTYQQQLQQVQLSIKYQNLKQQIASSLKYEQQLQIQYMQLKETYQNLLERTEAVESSDDVALISFAQQQNDIKTEECIERLESILHAMHLMHEGQSIQQQLNQNQRLCHTWEEQLTIIMDRQKKVLEEYDYDAALVETSIEMVEHQTLPLEEWVPQLANSMVAYTEPNFMQKMNWKLTKKLPKAILEVKETYEESIRAKKAIHQRLMDIDAQLLEVSEVHEKFPFLVTTFRGFLQKNYSVLKQKYVDDMKQIEQEISDSHMNMEKYDQLQQETINKLNHEEPTQSMEQLRETESEIAAELRKLGTETQYKQSLMLEKEELDQLDKKTRDELTELEQSLTDDRLMIEQLNHELEHIIENIIERTKIVNYLDHIDVDKESLALKQSINTCNEKMGQLKIQNEQYQENHKLKAYWLSLLQDAKDSDLAEIKKMYIKHANVIGITCVQSAKKDFVKDYPDFDVVIIDEVSKATPPELLLPMLKGKKIILVGDHHQLPPLVGQETLEEVTEKLQDPQKKEEVKNNLQESLFERLFKSLPEQHKSTLRIQYRMHEDIMETITQFYEQESETGYGLICGLENSNKMRDHYLNGQYVKRGQHIMWFDLPHEEAFFEKKEQGMTSPYNEAELKLIGELLKDLNEATATAKNHELLAPNAKKHIGIISFYGEQVRRLKHLVDELALEHLTFRIGTVDRFQGMESDIIFASFVRNHNRKSEDIGFANDYRRLNVALSRAKELLIVTGSTHMFMTKAKRAASRKMYQRVVETIRYKNGLRDHKGRVK